MESMQWIKTVTYIISHFYFINEIAMRQYKIKFKIPSTRLTLLTGG